MNPLDGVLVVDKPGGLTSQQVVSRVKRALGVRKAGHAGTLDPMATGVLVVGVGRATRLLGYVMGGAKRYEATIRLGVATTTDDAEGECVGDPVDATVLGEAAIRAAMAAYVGEIEQVPSAVSAIKVDGKRAYARVRAGEAVELASRRVRVGRFELLARANRAGFVDLDVVVDCSSGTYIRALARDLGRDLGVGGHLTSLRRTLVGPFGVERAVGLDEAAPSALVPAGEAARQILPVVEVGEAVRREIGHGRPVRFPVPSDPTAMLDATTGELLALYRPDGTRSVPVAVLAAHNTTR